MDRTKKKLFFISRKAKAIVWGEHWTKQIVETEEATEIWMLNRKTGKGVLWLREFKFTEEELMG